MPGAVMSRRQFASSRTLRSRSRSSSAARLRMAHQASRSGRTTAAKAFLVEEPADVGLEDPALALGHDKAEGLHQSADLVGEVGRNIEELSTGRRDRFREHGVAALDAHFLVPAGARPVSLLPERKRQFANRPEPG